MKMTKKKAQKIIPIIFLIAMFASEDMHNLVLFGFITLISLITIIMDEVVKNE